MYKSKALMLALLNVIFFNGITQAASLEEKIEKRFNVIATKNDALILTTRQRVELMQDLIEKIVSSERKKSFDSSTQDSLESFLMNIITKIQEAQEKYLGEMAVVYKKITHEKITKAEMEDASTLYARHLALFSDEVAFLIKLLLPLKDMDSMTQEEIQAVLTV